MHLTLICPVTRLHYKSRALSTKAASLRFAHYLVRFSIVLTPLGHCSRVRRGLSLLNWRLRSVYFKKFGFQLSSDQLHGKHCGVIGTPDTNLAA